MSAGEAVVTTHFPTPISSGGSDQGVVISPVGSVLSLSRGSWPEAVCSLSHTALCCD